MARWIEAGRMKMKWRETVLERVENAPGAFLDLAEPGERSRRERVAVTPRGPAPGRAWSVRIGRMTAKP